MFTVIEGKLPTILTKIKQIRWDDGQGWLWPSAVAGTPGVLLISTGEERLDEPFRTIID
jgi:hypothetical protein